MSIFLIFKEIAKSKNSYEFVDELAFDIITFSFDD